MSQGMPFGLFRVRFSDLSDRRRRTFLFRGGHFAATHDICAKQTPATDGGHDARERFVIGRSEK
jgi:hypothetical protein